MALFCMLMILYCILVSPHCVMCVRACVQEYDRHDEDHVAFWTALMVVADHELQEALKRDEQDTAHLRGIGENLGVLGS
jgi:sensor histidine kinase regulating citrate/malate metabolism